MARKTQGRGSVKKTKKKTTKKVTRKAKAAVLERPKTTSSKKFSPTDYVRKVAQQQKTGGCRVCAFPEVAEAIKGISKAMAAQKVKISAPTLCRDLERMYGVADDENKDLIKPLGFRCRPEKLREHLTQCLGLKINNR